jgi:phage terminase large subunit-like protein
VSQQPDAVIADDYLADVDPAAWSWADYLLRDGEDILKVPEGRRLLTAYDPLLFAVLYLRHHLASVETDDTISISDFHVAVCRHARTWCRSRFGPAESRTAWVAPRGSGKSTWFFLILPLWALAHGHRRFIAAFANSATQAEQHLLSLKRELDTNELLREDYPLFVKPAMRPSGTQVADRQDLLVTSSSAVFMAKGIDSSTLGAKIGKQRPDMLLFDDVEPDGSNYSVDQKEKRLATVRNAVFPMNLNAIAELVGTTTMQGSMIHDVVRQVGDEPAEETPDWPREENIAVQYFPAIVTDPDGSERSLWPQRWTLEFLESIRGTPSYALNMDNKPVSQGGWWQPGDVRYGRRDHYDRVVLFVDGAVTAKTTSDFTGLTVMGLSLAEKRLFIRESIGIKLTGEPRRLRILQLAVDLRVDYIMCEANQGGDMWLTELHDMPCRVATFKQSEPKPVRIRRFLSVFQRAGERIFLEKKLPQLETQLAGYPNLVHDDVIDSAAAAGEHLVAMIFASQAARRDQAAVHQFSYR